MKKRDKELTEILKEIDNHSGTDLSGEKLTGLDLSGKDFSGCDLTGTNFLLANLTGCNFENAKLDQADFSGANLANANFKSAKRNGGQVLKHASIIAGNKWLYGFLIQKDKKKKVLICEPNRPDYEFLQSTARNETAMLCNLLTND